MSFCFIEIEKVVAEIFEFDLKISRLGTRVVQNIAVALRLQCIAM
jgi:hypothetical protein